MIHITRTIGKLRKIPRRRPVRAAYLTAAVMLLVTAASRAGPPYVTDDPEPVPYDEVEAYLFSEGVLAANRFEESGTGLEINVGALPNLQLSGAIALEHGPHDHLRVGAAELGVKYRFAEEEENGWQPQIGFYPQAEIHLGNSADEDGATHYLLPLWAQKSLGDWTVFGGGGYHINPGVGRLNSWLGGLAVERPVGSRLSAGAEIYGETRDAKRESGLFGVGFGLTWELDERFELLGSAGPVFENHQTDLAYYFALGWHG